MNLQPNSRLFLGATSLVTLLMVGTSTLLIRRLRNDLPLWRQLAERENAATRKLPRVLAWSPVYDVRGRALLQDLPQGTEYVLVFSLPGQDLKTSAALWCQLREQLPAHGIFMLAFCADGECIRSVVSESVIVPFPVAGYGQFKIMSTLSHFESRAILVDRNRAVIADFPVPREPKDVPTLASAIMGRVR